MTGSEIAELRKRFCERKYGRDTVAIREAGRVTLATRTADCLAAVNPDTIAKRRDARRKGYTEVILPFGLLHDRFALEDYLDKSTGAEGLSLFSRFAANVSDEEAYVTSDIISGLAGRFMFAINYAAVVTKDESGATPAEQRAIESQKANVMRMINNGGTLAMRAQLPVFAISGHTGQSAASVYANSGLVGPTGNTDSLRFSGSGVAEFATTRSIRSMGDAADVLGELLLAARLGYAFSERELLSGTGDEGFGFFQFAVGLLQNNKISLSALYTQPLEGRYKPFAPRLMVNFAAIR
jgi:hypothetical protein